MPRYLLCVLFIVVGRKEVICQREYLKLNKFGKANEFDMLLDGNNCYSLAKYDALNCMQNALRQWDPNFERQPDSIRVNCCSAWIFRDCINKFASLHCSWMDARQVQLMLRSPIHKWNHNDCYNYADSSVKCKNMDFIYYIGLVLACIAVVLVIVMQNAGK